MAKQELKPCPFCGRKRIKVEPLGSFGLVNEEPDWTLWVVECKCGGRAMTEGKDAAIKIWNKRA